MENKNWTLGRRSTWLQILFWGGLWLLIPYIINVNTLDLMPYKRSIAFFMRNMIIFSGIFIIIFINVEYLIPQFYEQKKLLLYGAFWLLLLAFILFFISWEMMPWSDWVNPPQRRPRLEMGGPRMAMRAKVKAGLENMRYLNLAMPFITSLLGSSLFEIARLASEKDKETVKLQKEKLEAEMKFLKSQINPHFLFNSLNNIYTLILINSEKAGANLLKLSDMLRYMLYDCNADRVPLGKEIEYIENYIDLVKLKDSGGLNIKVDLSKSHPNLMIAPLLFIPFIENAFKHSKVEDLSKGWIQINLETEDQQVRLAVLNSVPDASFTKDQVGGIGLKNVRKQLALIYPNRHELMIEQDTSKFEVQLTIDLS